MFLGKLDRLILAGVFVAVWFFHACAGESHKDGRTISGVEAFYVTQTGTGTADGLTPGNAASLAAFNAGTGPFSDLAGDTVCFSGDFTKGLTTPCAGSQGKPVTLDLTNARFVGIVPNQVSISHAYIRVVNALLIQVADTGAVPAGVYVNGPGAQIDNCTIVGQGSSAAVPYSSGVLIGINGAGFSITRNNISHTCVGIRVEGLGFQGIIGGAGMGNTIHHCDAIPLDGADGIDIGTCREPPRVEDYTGLVISYNRIYEWNDDGIDLYYGSNVVVENNEVGPSSAASASSVEHNGIKCGSTDSAGGNIIRYNHVHDIDSSYGNDYGIMTNGAENITIIGNYVYDAYYGLIVSPNSSGHMIGNNTFSASRYRGASFGDNVTSTTFQNNICEGGSSNDLMVNAGDRINGGYNLFVRDTYHDTSIYTNTDGSDIFAADPLLSGPVLLEGSPCIDAGTCLRDVTRDIRGMSRPQGSAYDIGAFEWK